MHKTLTKYILSLLIFISCVLPIKAAYAPESSYFQTLKTNLNQSSLLNFITYSTNKIIYLSARTDRDGIGSIIDPKRCDTAARLNSFFPMTNGVTYILYPGTYSTTNAMDLSSGSVFLPASAAGTFT